MNFRVNGNSFASSFMRFIMKVYLVRSRLQENNHNMESLRTETLGLRRKTNRYDISTGLTRWPLCRVGPLDIGQSSGTRVNAVQKIGKPMRRVSLRKTENLFGN